MCDRHDQGPLPVVPVDDPVGKPGYKDAPEPTAEWAPDVGELLDSLGSALDRSDEVEAEPRALVFEVPRGPNELSLCFRMEPDALQRSVERAFLDTVFSGIPATSPDWTSSSLRSASASQSFSASASTPF